MLKRIAGLLSACVLLLLCGYSPAQQKTPNPAVDPYVKVKAPAILLAHVRVIDGTGVPAKEDQSILIRNGKIAWIGPAAEARSSDAQVLDLSGRTVIPGIVGMHEHMYYPTPGPGPAMYDDQAYSFPRLYLANGVTSIRTTGAVEAQTDLGLKQDIDAGKMLGPKIHITAPYLEGEGAYTPQMYVLKSPADAKQLVEFWADRGATTFKAYMNITPAELKAAIRAAHARKLTITGHLCSIGFREASQMGIDDLEHGLAVDTEFFAGKEPGKCPSARAAGADLAKKSITDPEIQKTIQFLVKHGTAVTSTLPVFETFVPGRAPKDARILDAMSTEARDAYLTATKRVDANADKSYWPQLFKLEMDFEREFVKQGGLLLAGLDPTGLGGVIAGFGDQREIELLVEAGFSPVEAIKIATYNGAKFLGELDNVGSIAVGKDADLVVINGNPATKISDIENTELVFKDGVGYDSQKIINETKGWVGIR